MRREVLKKRDSTCLLWLVWCSITNITSSFCTLWYWHRCTNSFPRFTTKSAHQVQTCNCCSQHKTYNQVGHPVKQGSNFVDTLAEVPFYCYLDYCEVKDWEVEIPEAHERLLAFCHDSDPGNFRSGHHRWMTLRFPSCVLCWKLSNWVEIPVKKTDTLTYFIPYHSPLVAVCASK